MRSPRFVIIIIFFLLSIIIPFTVAWLFLDDAYVFGGFLLNPMDGNSYLAKMYQGFSGSWTFVLPYTAQPGEGSFLFIFYLFLGHLARLTGLSLLLTFHLARVFSSIILIITLYMFYMLVFQSDSNKVFRALLLSSFGSGMGWLVSVLGLMTSDFWVAEAYPFLSSYANPHFPLGLAIFLWILMDVSKKSDWRNLIQLLILSILLSWIMQFGIVMLCTFIFCRNLIDWRRKRNVNWPAFLVILFFGGGFVGYQYIVIAQNPILSLWNDQNVTAAPPIWDLIISLSPALIFNYWGVKYIIKDSTRSQYQIILLWLFLGGALIYLPFNLQRRFMFGIYIPVVILCVVGVEILEVRFTKLKRIIWPSLLVISLLTNFYLLLAGSFAVRAHNPKLVIDSSEYAAFQWIEESTAEESLIMASPELGMFLPAYTGRKVLYGHPFETVNAQETKELVSQFYQGDLSDESAKNFIVNKNIDYIFFGQRESKLGSPEYISQFDVIYDSEEVKIFVVDSR